MRSDLVQAACRGEQYEVLRLLQWATEKNKKKALSESIVKNQLHVAAKLLEAGVPVSPGKLNQVVRRVAKRREYIEMIQLLLLHGAKIITRDSGWMLRVGSEVGILELVNAAVATTGCNLDETGSKGSTALIFATKNGNLQIVRALLNAGATVNERSRSHMTALMVAAQNGYLEMAQVLIEHGANAEMWDKTKNKVFDFAKGNPEMLNLLKKAHEDNMFRRADFSYFPIALEFMKTRNDWDEWNRVNIEMLNNTITFEKGFELLISSKGVNVDSVDIYNRTILMFASYFGYVGIVTTLLVHKAKTNLVDHSEMSALSWGTCGGQAIVVQLLIRYRAPLNYLDQLERTALHHAVRRRDYRVAHYLDYYGETLYTAYQLEGGLAWASMHGMSAIVERLLSFGINPNEADEDGLTGLMRATACGHMECVNFLLRAGAEVNIIDSDGKSALWWAIMNEEIEIEKLLLENNAKLGSTPIALKGLRLVVVQNQIGELKNFLKQVDDKTPDSELVEYFKSLVYSLRMNTWEIAEGLVEAAVDMGYIERRLQESILPIALEEGCPYKLAWTLIQKGADIKATDSKKNSPLDLTVHHEGEIDEERAKLIKWLLEKGVSVKVNKEKIGRDAAEVLKTNPDPKSAPKPAAPKLAPKPEPKPEVKEENTGFSFVKLEDVSLPTGWKNA